MTGDDAAADAALFRALRQTWDDVDPVPADLVDRMVAAVATDDLSREYALLTLVEGAALGAVRGDAEMLTMQFSDGTTSVLVHVTIGERGLRRLDGWVDAPARSVHLLQGEREWTTDLVDDSRFAFDGIPAGLSRLRLVLEGGRGDRAPTGGSADAQPEELMTPHFEV